jgi:protein phosphatase
MATTCTALAVCGGEVVVAHVGDSRAYRLRGNELAQLTQDHTLVHDLLERGVITGEQARNHPQANVITRALGSQPEVEVDIVELTGQAGDCYLLCSDGLSNLVTDKEIAHMLAIGNPEDCCEAVVELARERGGYDNITVQVIKLSANEPKSAGETTQVTPTFSNMPALTRFFVLLFVLLVAVTSVLGISFYFLGPP